MALDPKYIIAPNFYQFFIDKTNGLPMTGGKLKFFSDVNRTTPKPVYQLSGSPPNYTYLDVGSEFILSGVGTLIDDSGNHLQPYYYCYDADGQAELYFVEVYNADDVLQDTFQAWPNFSDASQSSQGSDITNYIPNGQFWPHNNIPADVENDLPEGQVPSGVLKVDLAPGGWVFERPILSTAIDNITFNRTASYTTSPTGSPRYTIRAQCVSANPSDAYKRISVRFQDVNKFASDEQQYTFTFSGVTDLSADFNINVDVVKNFGTGGSAQTVTTVTTFTITDEEQIFSVPIIFGNNNGKNVGALDDDYVEVSISLPTSISYAVLITDFSLLIGNIEANVFPTQTTRDMLVRSVSPPTPDPDGYDLALPLISTKDGLAYDTSQVGKIFISSLYTPAFGELNCDGATIRSDAYSPDGIPYRRLRDALVSIPAPTTTLPNVPIFGTGSDYVLASHVGPDVGYVSNNKPGLQTVMSDGVNPTGFTFTTVSLGRTDYSTLGLRAWQTGVDGASIWVLCQSPGFVTTVNASTTGTIVLNGFPDTSEGEVIGTDVAQQLVKVTFNALPPAGSYFNINTPSAAIVPWFKVDGAGSAPSVPGATLVEIDLLSSMGGIDVTYAVSQVLSACQTQTFQTVSGSVIPANSYFTFYANSQQYYVWYSRNGSGTDPSVSGAIGIPVVYTTGHSNTTVLVNTMRAINDVYYGLPDLRGWSIKGWDNGADQDQNILNRFQYSNSRYNNPVGGDKQGYIGSYQFSSLLSHAHKFIESSGASDSGIRFDTVSRLFRSLSDPVDMFECMNAEGTGQNDTKNVYFNYVIKY